MALWDLSRIDAVVTKPGGVNGIILIATDWQPEALRLAQLAVKAEVARDYGQTRPPYEIEVRTVGVEVPESAVAFARRFGCSITSRSGPVTGRAGSLQVNLDGDLDWSAVQAANAAQFAREHRLPGTVDSLRRVDELLTAAYETAAADRDADGYVPEDGNLAILAAAYVGDVLIKAFGGQWLGPPAFHISA